MRLARIAEAAGIAMVAVHGRTARAGLHGQRRVRHDRRGEARASRIPVVANGDIDSPQKAREVLARTGADAIMIGRAAQGRPWIFREIAHFLATGEQLPPPRVAEVKALAASSTSTTTTRFYGEYTGVRIARKHIGWTLRGLPGGDGVPRAR